MGFGLVLLDEEWKRERCTASARVRAPISITSKRRWLRRAPPRASRRVFRIRGTSLEGAMRASLGAGPLGRLVEAQQVAEHDLRNLDDADAKRLAMVEAKEVRMRMLERASKETEEEEGSGRGEGGTEHAQAALAQAIALRQVMAGGAPTLDVLEAATRPSLKLKNDGIRTAIEPVETDVVPQVKAMEPLRREKEERLRGLANRRLELLEAWKQKLPMEERIVAEVEIRKLRLIDAQRKLRRAIAMEKKLEECSLETLFDWTRMRRSRKMDAPDNVLFSEAVLTAHNLSQKAADKSMEAIAKQVGLTISANTKQLLAYQHGLAKQRSTVLRAERARREEFERKRMVHDAKMKVLQARRKFLAEVSTHQVEWRMERSNDYKRLKVRNDHVSQWHREERKRRSRAERSRINALKTENMEEYIRMIQESKNERINTVLSRTDDILLQLGNLVVQQKFAATGEENVVPMIGGSHRMDYEEVADDAAGFDLLKGQKRYNALVHDVKERVKEQPSSLEGGTLRHYQLQGLQWMVSLYNNKLNGILADEMGLGKTIQSVAFIAYLMEHKGNFGPHIIVAPKAVISNWANEFMAWLPQVNLVVYDGSGEDRRIIRETQMSDLTFNVLLTHYDLIMRDKAHLSKIQWYYCIIDEGHRLKNHQSKLAEIFNKNYTFKQRLLLTGTPIQNNLSELWSLLNFLLPKVFKSSDTFDEWFAAPFKGSGEDVSLNEEEELLVINRLHQVIRPFLLRRKKDEVEKELPDKVSIVLKCDMSAWQKLYYKQITQSSRVMIETASGKSRSLQNSAMQLRKVCNHPYLFFDEIEYVPEDAREIIRASGKFELLDRILPKLKKAGHRCLIFSQMTKALDLLGDYLSLVGFKFLRLDGMTKTNERAELIQLFNEEDSEYFIFLLSTRAGGLGLNLQTADTVIMFDSDWNPQMDAQAEDRAHRIGQRKEVRVLVMVSVGSIEEEIINRAREKRNIDSKVIQAGMFNNQSTIVERKEMLERIIKKGVDALGGDIPSAEEVNRLIARSEDEFYMFQEMDRDRRTVYGNKPRLITDEELPDWAYGNQEALEEDGDEIVVGQKRKRKDVIYSDILSDERWMRIVDEGGDLDEAVQQKQEQMKRRRKARDSVDVQQATVEQDTKRKTDVEASDPALEEVEDMGEESASRRRSRRSSRSGREEPVEPSPAASRPRRSKPKRYTEDAYFGLDDDQNGEEP